MEKINHVRQQDTLVDRELQTVVNAVNEIIAGLSKPTDSYPGDTSKATIQVVNVGSNLYSVAVNSKDGKVYSIPGLFQKTIPAKGIDLTSLGTGDSTVETIINPTTQILPAGNGYQFWNGNNSWSIPQSMGSKSFYIEKDGDIWITANAYWNGANWLRIDVAKTSFALNLRGTTDFPGEADQGGCLWVASAGSNPIGAFGVSGGWELGFDITAFRDMVVGGYSIEVDGHGTTPYFRLQAATVSSIKYQGLLKNVFGDHSGYDNDAVANWFFGLVELANGTETFRVRRSAAGTLTWAELLNIDSSGNGTFLGTLAASNLSGTNTGDYTHPNHSGEVTSVADGAQTIANAAVTLAKMANLAQNTIIGRVTASTGVPEALTAANVRTIINVADGATANAKASGAEIDTGSDDDKFATAKAITDSKLSFIDGTESLTNKTLTDPKIITTFNNQTGTTYTFVLTDASKHCTFSNAAAITVTVPPNSSVAFPIGTQIDCSQIAAGKVTFVGGSGVTINSQGGNLAIAAQWVGVTLLKTAENVWTLFGNLIA